eukprot:TRINITY_DN2491_c0_g1_i2.p1 TRINITY_DN2491_c0_g1~~TRINITY_DN2491_c0_g1_i2.p1  ORF type:complete len:168 (+),score=41.05 TRINITY_DN2491_c0_g1_i2:51-554(+)
MEETTRKRKASVSDHTHTSAAVAPSMSAPFASSLNASDLPRDAKVMAHILQSMGVEDYEPRVIHQLIEFMYRYLSEVFQDAQVYSQHANKTALDVEDVRLAVQMRVNTSFTQPPPREVILEIAQQKNSQPLPPIPQKFGIRLPPEQHCLTQPNYQLDTKKMKVDEEK